MKKAFVYGLLVALTITGCQAELEEVSNNEPDVISQETTKVFTAIVDEDFNRETKTSLDGSGNVLWKMGDQVSIFAGSTVNEQYQVTDASDGKTVASLNKIPAGDFVAGGEIDNNVAFYPYASTAEIAKSESNYVISEIELPATQTYAAGSFGNGAFPMATVTSSTEDMNLKFKNVLGGLKLQLKGTATITSIIVTGNNNEILCGDAEVTMVYGGVPSISLSDASAKTVTLDCCAGVTLDSETATPFIIALPPITMTGGFTVVVTDTEGKEMEISTSKPQTITRSNLLRMPAVNYVGESIDPYLSQPLTFTSTGSTTIALNRRGFPDAITLEYKVGGGDWTSYTIGDGIDLTNGETLQFRAGSEGNTTLSQSNSHGHFFSLSGAGTIDVSGNIMSLLDRSLSRQDVPASCFYYFFQNSTNLLDAEHLKLPATTLAPDCYYGMFKGCTNLTTSPKLPATTLASNCYDAMFNSCTSLTTAPELPATTLANSCYYGMFYGCTNLTIAPELPATTLAPACYQSMFSVCTSLTTAPELPATTLAESCYRGMFYGCTNLTIAPELPATTLAKFCYYYMFYGCTNLTTSPKLPATTLANSCYYYMFHGCANLTTAPELPATTLTPGCYYYMFHGCTSLTTAPELPATTLASNCYDGMFYGCTSITIAPELPATTLAYSCYKSMFKDCINLTTTTPLGTTATTLAQDCCEEMFCGCTNLTTAPELPATTLAPGCYYGMFNGCTNLTTAPELPATTLANTCYSGMFYGCTSLTIAPELPATTLAYGCYYHMFTGCSSLNYIKMLATDISASNCLYNWVKGVSDTGTFVKNSSATWDVTGVDGVPSGWTVITE